MYTRIVCINGYVSKYSDVHHVRPIFTKFIEDRECYFDIITGLMRRDICEAAQNLNRRMNSFIQEEGRHFEHLSKYYPAYFFKLFRFHL